MNIIIDILIVCLSLPVTSILSDGIQQWGILSGLNTVFANILRVGLATWVLRRQGITWAALGLRRPERLVSTFLVGVAAAVGGFLLVGLIQGIMATIFANMPSADRSLFDSVNGNISLLIFTLIILWTVIAIGEELTWRVFMINRFSALFGENRSFKLVGLLASAILFGLLHSYQGIGGAIAAGVLGMVFGAAYLLARQNVWVPVIAHGLINTIFLVYFYAM
jgi:membrane protease YdiL (CAAX protease family)